MLAFTQVNSLTDIKRAGRDKEHNKSSGEVIRLARLLLLLSKKLQHEQQAKEGGGIASVNSADNSAGTK